MKRSLLILSLFLLSFVSFSQRSFWEDADSLSPPRFTSVSTGISGTWIGSYVGLSQIWYKDVEKTPWHSFDDSKNWLQMDKAGHFYAAYKINALTTGLYNWSGLAPKKSIWLGAGVSIGYQLTLEMFDAYSAEWGFSGSDVIANTVGTTGYLTQQLLWKEERIIPKFSYTPSPYAALRPHILGSSFSESLLKDYNGQTYWLSFSPGTFLRNSPIPKWACISLGYSVNAKLVGDEEIYIDPLSQVAYYSRREFILSLDIDFSKLPIRRPWLKKVVHQLNYLKVPFPALVLSDHQFLARAVYF